MLLRPASRQIVQLSHRDLLSQDEKDYLDSRLKNWDFFMGRMADKQYFPRRQRETTDEYHDRINNLVTVAITTRVVDALVDNIYGLGIDRRFPDDEESNQKALDTVLDWVGGQNFFCEDLQTTTEVAGTCAIVPRFDPETRRVSFDCYSGEYVTVRTMPGSIRRIEGFEIEFDQARTIADERVTKKYYERWDRGDFEVRWGDKTLLSGPNPYAPDLPIVCFRARHNPQSWYGWTPIDAVVDANQVLNDYLTDFKQIVRKHGYPMLAIIGTEIAEFEKGISRAMALPAGEGEKVDAKYLVPGGPFRELLDFFDWWVTWIANQANVPVQLVNVSAGNVESGYALTIRFRPFTTGLERKRRLYMQSERELWRLVFRMLSIHAGREGGVDEGLNPSPDSVANMVIDFNEEVLPDDPQAVMDREVHDLDLGFESQVTLLMKREPGLTEEDAEQKLRDNIALRDELRGLGAAAQERLLNRQSGEME